MYRIIKDGASIGMTEAPNYIKQAANGCFNLCPEPEASGIVFAGTVYHLLDREEIDGAETVTLEETDAGTEIIEVRSLAENSAKLNGQMNVATKLFVQSAPDISDDMALEMPDLFKTWDDVLSAGQELPQDTIINKDVQLYRVVQAVTPQEHQPPDAEGMLAIYRPIVKGHAGTQDDPIPFIYGMDTEQGKYYSYNGKLYLCNLSMTPCVWAPDTAGLWQWTEVTEVPEA